MFLLIKRLYLLMDLTVQYIRLSKLSVKIYHLGERSLHLLNAITYMIKKSRKLLIPSSSNKLIPSRCIQIFPICIIMDLSKGSPDNFSL
ncbi:hypothetical protein QUC31_012496 [Theobroma cacao]